MYMYSLRKGRIEFGTVIRKPLTAECRTREPPLDAGHWYFHRLEEDRSNMVLPAAVFQEVLLCFRKGQRQIKSLAFPTSTPFRGVEFWAISDDDTGTEVGTQNDAGKKNQQTAK